jgi:hypothetical protein
MKIKIWLTVSRIEQSGRTSLRRPKPQIKEEEEEESTKFSNLFFE